MRILYVYTWLSYISAVTLSYHWNGFEAPVAYLREWVLGSLCIEALQFNYFVTVIFKHIENTDWLVNRSSSGIIHDCLLRICPVCVAVPHRVPNPRPLAFLQHRSPVWSQLHSSSRLTCSALALCSLTNRLKVSEPLDALKVIGRR